MAKRITVKLFALLRETAGVSELSLDLPAGSTGQVAADDLAEKFPALRTFLPRCAYAINRAYAKAGDALHDGDELALIPPVSGGAA
jgi:molybdopterin converting factor subunit 1